MDVVLRTPHGEGEISLVVDSASVTLGDIVERALGHPAPPVIYVDGHAVAAHTTWADSGAVVGSLIDTDDAAFRPAPRAAVELRQLAGPGCGTVAPLLAGDYRIGPGRRVHADELSMAPVDDAVMELRVGDDGRVRVRDRQGVQLIGGQSTDRDRFVEWSDEPLSIHGRIFELDRPTVDWSDGADDRLARRANGAGMVTFHRAVVGDVRTDRRASLTPNDALSLARTHSPDLWRFRDTGPGEFSVPIGLHIVGADDRRSPRRPEAQQGHIGGTDDDGNANGTSQPSGQHLQTIRAELDSGRGVAYVGRPDFTRSAAYGLLVLAATMYGPADLDVVVATTPDRAHDWEWVKWLPHARVDGRPNVMVDSQQLRGWLHRTRQRWASTSATTRRTLMLVDDENAWHERDSPLREIVADDGSPISFVVLTTHLHDVPTLCETVVSERSHGTAHVDLRLRRRRFDDVHAFIVSAELAAEVARRLAPLDDAALAPDPRSAAGAPLSVVDLHGLGKDPRSVIADRWNRAADASPEVSTDFVLRFGRGSTSIAAVDLTEDGPHLLALVPDGDHEAGRDVIDVALLGACVDHPPDEFELVILAAGSIPSLFAQLPHVSAAVTHLDAHRIRRSTRNLMAEQRRRRAMFDRVGVTEFAAYRTHPAAAALPRLVVFVDYLDAAADVGLETIGALLQLDAEVGIHVIVRSTTAHTTDDLLGQFGVIVEASVGPTAFRGHALPATPTNRARITSNHRPAVEFEPPDITASADDEPIATAAVDPGTIHLEPFVVARDLTPMEKRLAGDEPAEAPTVLNGAALDIVEALAIEAEARPRLGRPPVTDELPARLDLLDFLREHPGDGVPFALADAPDAQRHEPMWWLPGANSSMIAFGVARSKMSGLIPALAIGAATRLGSADVQFHFVGVDTTTMGPLARLPHTASLVAARSRTQMTSLVAQLSDEVDRRLLLAHSESSAQRVAASETAIVLMVDDVGACRRLLDGGSRDLWAEIEQLIVRGQQVGFSAILVARRSDEISTGLAAAIHTRLVAQLAANDSDERFGLIDDGVRPPIAGRARTAPDGVDLQLASLPADFDRTISEHGLDRAEAVASTGQGVEQP